MAAGVVVLRLHRAGERGDRLEVRLAHLLGERRRLERRRELRLDRLAQALPALDVAAVDQEPADDPAGGLERSPARVAGSPTVTSHAGAGDPRERGLRVARRAACCRASGRRARRRTRTGRAGRRSSGGARRSRARPRRPTRASSRCTAAPRRSGAPAAARTRAGRRARPSRTRSCRRARAGRRRGSGGVSQRKCSFQTLRNAPALRDAHHERQQADVDEPERGAGGAARAADRRPARTSGGG